MSDHLSWQLLWSRCQPIGAEFSRPDGTPHDPESRLCVTIDLSGVWHHLDLLEIFDGDDGQQHTVIAELDHYLDAAYMIGGATALVTHIHAGRPYVALLVPFEAS